MDLNELLYQHQVALMRVAQSRSASPTAARFDLVGHYAKRIRDYRRTHSLTQYSV
jgi:hypothetical protein